MIPSLYIHIPFCKKRCLYCDFYSSIYDASLASLYIDCIIRQAEVLDVGFSTIYIGGGTPSVLENRTLEKMLRALVRLARDTAEITIEANPDSLNEEKIRLFLDNGVNRISIGTQSFNDRKLQALGRRHNSKRSEEGVCLAHKKGFKNISIDLIYGAWLEDKDSWLKDLEKAVNLPVTHISCYGLTYEKNTPLGAALKDGGVKPLDDEIVAGMYEDAIGYLSSRGFKQYEVSNFSKEGYHSKHNLNYWDNNSYIGLGASAVSYIDGTRKENIPDLAQYMEKVKNGEDAVIFSEKLDPMRRAKETAALKIRTREGIGFAWFKDNTGYDFLDLEKKVLGRLVEDGLIKYIRDKDDLTGVCLRQKGFIFCDSVSSAFL